MKYLTALLAFLLAVPAFATGNQWSFVQTTANFTDATHATPTAIVPATGPSLVIAMRPNQRLTMRCNVLIFTGTATVAPRIGMTTPSAATLVSFVTNHILTATTSTTEAFVADGISVATDGLTSAIPATLEAFVVNGANAGNVSVTLDIETTGTTATARAGSWCEYQVQNP